MSRDESFEGVRVGAMKCLFRRDCTVALFLTFCLLVGFAGLCRVAAAQQPDDTETPTVVPQIFSSGIPPTASPDTSSSGALSNNTSNQQGTRSTQTSTGTLQRQQQEMTSGQQRSLLQPRPAPTDFQRMVTVTTGRTLPIFGDSIFSGTMPSTFAPVIDIPVTPDYVIGPGDELRIQIWGQVNLRGSYTVDRTGAISLPGAGTVHVAGLRFDQVTEFLRSQLGRIYRNFDINVNMGQLRSIQVFVVGEARRPGSYTIGSMSTLLNALFASGGPKPQGSLRDIQVKRNGKTLVHFDLYDLLLHGDKSKDVPLASGDVIFIPPVGPQVAVVGSVGNPAIYELHGKTTIEQALQLAGGRSKIAVDSQARVERIFDHAVRSVIEVNLPKSADFLVQDGDIVTINAIVDRFKNAVTLRGNVANPGRYVWHPGMRISDLIPNKDVLTTRNYWQKKNDLGQMTVNYEPEPERDAQGVLQPARNRYSTINSNNAVDGMTGNVMPSSGNSQNAEDQSSAMQGQYAGQDGTPQVPVTGSTTGGSSLPTQQANGAGRETSNTTTGGNSVGAAMTGSSNRFPIKTDVSLIAPEIDWSYAVVERRDANTLKTSLLPFNLGKVILDGDQSQNLELLPGDVVTIFSTADIRVPISEQTRLVRLEGEFVSPGVYSVQPGENLRHLLKRAGGFTPDAYLYASEFTRESTRRVQKQRLNEYADQLETQAAAAAAAGNATALNDRDAAAATAAASSAQASIARLRRAQPIGRIVLQLKPDSRGIDSLPDLPLEDGDRFVVPKVPANVNVEGEVYSANAFLYQRGKRTIDYLREAGGPDRQADMKHAFVLRADGSVLSQQYRNIKHATIFPGDTIVVPPQLQKRSVMRNLVDIATIVGQFGLGIAAINVLK